MQKFLFRPTDIASLCFFRIVFGILALIEIISVYTYQRWWIKAWAPDQFRFKYYGFEWVEPLPEPLLSFVFLCTALAAIGVILGWRYRLSATLWALGFTYSFLLEKAFYLNHGYLFSVLSFVMIFLPAQYNYSLDAWQGSVQRVRRIPYWPVFLLCFLMGVVYFYGGIAKINPDWLRAVPLKIWLKSKADLFLIGALLKKEWTAYFMSYAGLLLDLFIVFFLLFKPTRGIAFLFVIFFHLMNMMIFQIGIFPWLSTALTAMYFPTDFPRKVFPWLGKRIKILQNMIERWNTAWGKIPEAPFYESRMSPKLITGILSVFCLAQILIPLRQHLYPGNTAWTEYGHRGAWRMMLRSKSGLGNFKVVDKETGKTEVVRPSDYLHTRQRRKMYGQPDMILEFAHFIRKEYLKKGWKDPAVYANIKLRLNDRRYQPYVDPDFDLGTWQWKFLQPAEWLLEEKADTKPKTKQHRK